MKNSIWVGVNRDGGTYVFTDEKPVVRGGQLHGKWYGGAWYSELFALELKPLEIVEIIINTETQSYEIKREREIGWYLTERARNLKYAVARYWNGEDWCAVPNDRDDYDSIQDGGITVLSDKLPYNEYLEGLE